MTFRKISIYLLTLVAAWTGVVTTAGGQTMPVPQKEQLLNGLKVLMWPDAKSDKVTIKIRVHAGAAFDPQGKEGVMQLLADNLFPNPATKEFFAEDLGGGLDVSTTYDYIQVTASMKPESLLTGLETLATAISNPPLEKDTTGNLRSVLINRIKELESDPGYVGDRAAAKRLLGTFPYGRAPSGTPETLQGVDFADLIDAKLRLLTADNATIAVSGNFDRTTAFRAIRRYFGSWLKADKKLISTFRQPDDPPAGILKVPSPKAETAAIRIAVRGTARSDKDFAASQVFTSILAARLKAQVAAANASDVFVRNEAHVLPGQVTVGFAIASKDAAKTTQATDVVIKALSDPVTEAEFQAARSQLLTEWSKRSPDEFWLDVDTFKTDANADRAAFDTVRLSDVAAYAEKLRKSPSTIVVVNTPPAGN